MVIKTIHPSSNWMKSQNEIKTNYKEKSKDYYNPAKNNNNKNYALLKAYLGSCMPTSSFGDAPDDKTVWGRWSTAGCRGDMRCGRACPRCRPPAWGRSQRPEGAGTHLIGLLWLLNVEPSKVGYKEREKWTSTRWLCGGGHQGGASRVKQASAHKPVAGHFGRRGSLCSWRARSSFWCSPLPRE